MISKPTSEIKFRQDLYPRLEHDPQTVEQYADSELSAFPPIEINQHNELIDGWHRWTLHKKLAVENINCIVTHTESYDQFLELAIERNAKHGKQLSREDKRHNACSLYARASDKKRKGMKERLAKMLSVGERTVHRWLSNIDQDSKESRDKRIFQLWLACYTQDEISEVCDSTQDMVSESLRKSAIWQDSVNRRAVEHNDNFAAPISNYWEGLGNNDRKWIDNLLYLYTDPLETVLDPFASSGSTIDVCKKRFRRYWVCDQNPVVERADDIRAFDIQTELPSVPRWKDVALVYLNPPKSLEFEATAKIISKVSTRIKQSQREQPAYIALFTQTLGREYARINLPISMRYCVPREQSEFSQEDKETAIRTKTCLPLAREIIVWRG